MRFLHPLIILSFLALGCAGTNLPPLTKGPNSEDDEGRLWRLARAEEAFLEGAGILYDDKELEGYLQKVVKNLEAPRVQRRFNFRVKVIKDPHLNAFAFPDGAIFVHTGLLARLDNEAQLAALLAHEMTHVTGKHALRAAKRLKSDDRKSGPPEQGSSGPDNPGQLWTLFPTRNSMGALTDYSEKLETEADLVGLRLMAKAGYESNEALLLLGHLMHEVDGGDSTTPFLAGAHAQIQKRIKNVKRFLHGLKQPEGQASKNTPVFLEKIGKLVLDNAFLDLKAGRFGAALRGAEKYLMIRPNDAKTYFLLGEIFRQRGGDDDITEARAFYKKAISMDQKYAEPHKAMGLIYFKMGKWSLAKRSFERALSISPHPPDQTYIRHYLRRCVKIGADS